MPSDAGALRTRIHGDFHLGQVLVAQGDAYLIDFEGEPARALEERRQKSSPLRDVAGLIAFTVLCERRGAVHDRKARRRQTADRKRALFERFRAQARKRSCANTARRWRIRRQPIAGARSRTVAALLDLFLIEKAAYEIRYEAANRPTWLGLPLRGLASLASRLLGDTGAPLAPGQRPEAPAPKDTPNGTENE